MVGVILSKAFLVSTLTPTLTVNLITEILIRIMIRSVIWWRLVLLFILLLILSISVCSILLIWMAMVSPMSSIVIIAPSVQSLTLFLAILATTLVFLITLR